MSEPPSGVCEGSRGWLGEFLPCLAAAAAPRAGPLFPSPQHLPSFQHLLEGSRSQRRLSRAAGLLLPRTGRGLLWLFMFYF